MPHTISHHSIEITSGRTFWKEANQPPKSGSTILLKYRPGPQQGARTLIGTLDFIASEQHIKQQSEKCQHVLCQTSSANIKQAPAFRDKNIVQTLGLWGRVFAEDLFKCGRMLWEHILGSDVKFFECALDVRRNDEQRRASNSSPKLPHQISASGIVPELKTPVRVQSPPGAHLFTSVRLQHLWTVWHGRHCRYHCQRIKACQRLPLAEARYFFGIWSVFQVWCRICGIVQEFPALETEHQIKQVTKTLQVDMAYLSNTRRVILLLTYRLHKVAQHINPISITRVSTKKTRHPCSMVGTMLDVYVLQTLPCSHGSWNHLHFCFA